MSSTGSHIGKGGQIRNNAHSSHVMGMAPGNGGAPQQQGFVQRPIQSRGPAVAGLQQPPYSDQLFPGMHTSAEEASPVSLSFGDLAVNTQNRVPSSSAPYSNPAFPPNFNHQPGIPILNPLGPAGAHNLARPPVMRPGLFPMPSGPLGMPQAMVGGPPNAMMNPHIMMLPGMSPAFFGMPQPPLGNIQPAENAAENVLSHMNRKKNVLKFFSSDDSQQTESKSDAQSLPTSAPAVAVAPTADALPSVAKADEPSPRTATSAHASGGSPRASAPNASSVSFVDNHPQHHAVLHASDRSSAPNESAASASRADDTKTPSVGVSSASQHSSKHPHSQNTSRTSMNLLGSALSPSAPAPQPRPTPSASAHRGQTTTAAAANAQAASLTGAGRTVYTRELLLDLQHKPHTVSAQTLDRINKLNLGLNCVPSAGVQGGRASSLQLPQFPQVGRRLPMGNKAGGASSASSSRVPQQKHSISENSFVAKMQKMSDDVVEKKKKNIQLILNQLTSENFQKLCEKLYKEIDSVEALEIVQTKIYDKAVLDQQQNPAPGQPTFVELYAKVCLIIVQDNQRTNPSTGEPGKLFFHPDQPLEEARGGQFRRSLLNRCQEEFERPSHGRTEGWQQLSEVDRYNQQMKEKRRTLGNVDFVGQLFLHGLLAEKTLHHCFKLLLEKHYQIFDFFNQPGSPQPQDSDFDQLESFCKLLTTVGRTVDRPQAKQFMDSYFSYLQQIMGQPTIIPRMKFHIEQIIELRRCNWDQASMRENRCMPSSTSKLQKASVASVLKPMPGNGTAKPAPVLVQPKPAPTSGKPSPASKQPQSSKVVISNSRLNSGNSNGLPSSSVPAAPKADLMSLTLAHLLEHRDTPDTIDDHHVRSLESMFAEWKCNHIHAEVADCLCELNQPYTHALFVHDIVTQCCDAGPSFFIKCAELLETLSRKPNCLNQDKLEEALRLLGSTEFEQDMRLDVPGYLDFFALIVARGITNGWIKQTLALQVFEVGKGVGVDKLRAALDAAERMCESADSGEDSAES